MASSPSYGDRPPLQGYRRSFTLPPRVLSFHERAGLNEADADSNILFSHPSARIIAFSPPTDSIPSTSKETLPETDYPVDTIETLPWRSRTEMLAATGPIVIEKVRGSSNFLKSADQKVIHTIMRNSQCWCVDGESKFVLRIGKFRYYRIELPAETEADKEKVQELKTVLGKILRFERTPCPFKRAFHVDLPDDAITPRRKGAWKRKQVPISTAPNTDPLPLQRIKTTRTWSLQGQGTPTPLQAYGRRGSDYGFSASRGPSPRPQYEPDGYRPATPSSLASSEEVGDIKHDETSSEEGSHQETPNSNQDNSSESLNMASPLKSPVVCEDAPSPGQLSETVAEMPELSDRAEHLSTPTMATSPIEPHFEDAGAPTEPLPSAVVEGAVLVEGADEEDVQRSDNEHSTQPVSNLAAVEVPEIGSSPNDELDASSEGAPAELPEKQTSAPFEELGDISQPTHRPDSCTPVESTNQDLLPGKVEDPEPVGIVPHEQTPEAALSRVSSADSFHTTASLAQEMLDGNVESIDIERTPQTETFNPFSINVHQHRRDISELTVTASTVDEHVEETLDPRSPIRDSFEEASTPALGRSTASESSWPEVQTPSPLNDGLRRRLNMKRSLSPLPPSATLFSPSSSPSQGGHFTAAILQKACNVALVKPVEAVVLLVHILARIAGGATVNDLLSGDLFRRPEQHRRRSSFPDQVSSMRLDSEDEDDFGVPLRGRPQSADVKSTTTIQGDHPDSIFDLD
ncbi:hypothetical protein A1O1_06025 [Capronia coronata CBS 617.96]|uniref:Inheritance of peroxisomes protein 1 n=1 Tax=Capronia coronata CBS 617.96 TaxID=1182541 RepID=W9YTP5_9EURO|nr:uncharacterized protein A1O1_06025 [Capronia coronata CBS 617.96]EXJ85659.1 hypothetical protein A1O1_06025 [Capronia coronata CBS 617.96]